MVKLGPYIKRRDDWGDIEYECAYCDRTFRSLNDLESHCRFSGVHAWCDRCERVFRRPGALQQHQRDSSVHIVCTICRPYHDFSCYSDLRWHRRVIHNLPVCLECGREFQNENNLRMHRKVHAPRNLPCFGCGKDRMFASFSAMLIHLEAGNCSSGADRDRINQLAFECYQHKRIRALSARGKLSKL
ncbi:hypothetical protein VTO42DRAFT_641 [Malbranchea cinnamomea]